MNRDPAIVRAERLRTVVSTPEYKDTVGRWIEEARDNALLKMSTATDMNSMFIAQGAYNAIKELSEQLEAVFINEEIAIKKLNKKREMT